MEYTLKETDISTYERVRTLVTHTKPLQNSDISQSLSKTKNFLFDYHTRLVAKFSELYRTYLQAHIGLVVNAMAISGLVTAVVLAGSIQSGSTTQPTQLRNERVGGFGGVNDQTANAYAAAYIANEANLAAAELATEQARKLTQEAASGSEAGGNIDKPLMVSVSQPVDDKIANYTVKEDDTVQKLAKRFEISADTIRWANNLSSSAELTSGQQLKILPVTGVLHTAKEDDTIEKLANKYQANATQIATYNDTEINGLKPGQSVIIPNGQQPEPTAPAGPTRSNLYNQYASFAPQYNGNGYSYGYCTWYVSSKRDIPSNWGNAISWLYNAQASGYETGNQPKQGAVAWEPIGALGHVSYVEKVTDKGMLVSEMNYSGWGTRTTRFVPRENIGHFQFIY